MTLEAELRGCPPRTLSAARACAHRAVQLLTLAARANLEALPDDSHSSLVWERGKRRFASLPLKSPGGEYRVLLAMPSMRLGLANHAGIAGQLSLEGISPAQAVAWLDGQLGRVGLRAASAVALPYALPPDAAALAGFRAAPDAAPLATLAAWYDLADSLLGRVAERLSEVKPGAGPIRVWPHHFDIASFVRLRPREDELAPGIGIGLSPGDESYDQPYLYATP